MLKSKTAGTKCLIVLGRPAEMDDNEIFYDIQSLILISQDHIVPAVD